MAHQWMFGSRRRDSLWCACRLAAYLAGRGNQPICPHCDEPVTADQAWDECHVGAAKAFGGKSVAVGHRACNRLDNALVVTPAFAKSNRLRKRALGLKGPGLGRYPMRAGRRSGVTKTIWRGLQPRLSLAEKHARAMARRAIVPAIATTPTIAPTEV